MLLIMSYWTKLFLIWGKLRRAHPTKSGHFAPAYLGGSDELRASLEFLYVIAPFPEPMNIFSYILICESTKQKAKILKMIQNYKRTQIYYYPMFQNQLTRRLKCWPTSPRAPRTRTLTQNWLFPVQPIMYHCLTML